MGSTIVQLLKELTEYVRAAFHSLPWVIIVLLIIAIFVMLVVIILTILAMRRAAVRVPPSAKDPKQKEEDKKQKEQNAYKLPPIGGWISEYLSKRGYVNVSSLSLSFLRAIEFLKNSLSGYNYKYALPWYVMIGPEGCGKTTLIEGADISLPLGKPDFGIKEANPECRWWFLPKGIFLDIRGTLFSGKTNTQSDERGWRSLLVLLSRYRAARPLNGIILCIPMSELYGKNKIGSDDLANRANYFATKLGLLQSSLGLRLPVFVVITKTDTVPGFQNFCAEIPLRNRSNMIGWSSSYSLSTVYTQKWVDEAFSSIDENLNQLRLEILAEATGTTGRDGVFVFPNELTTVKETLSIYLNALFKNDAYHEPMLFRGLYFTGDSGLKPLEQDNADNSTSFDEGAAITIGAQLPTETSEKQDRKIFFITDLISEKICKEIGLAVPLFRKLLTANHAINFAKIGTAIFILISTYGLFNAYDKFTHRRDFILPVLSKMNVLLRDMQTLKENQSSEMFDTYARQLIEMMDQLQDASFFSIFVPASWFSQLQYDLKHTLKISYQQVIVRTVYIDLLLKARTLLHRRPTSQNQSTSLGQLLQPTRSAEFGFVKGYVEDLSKLQEHITKFNNLRYSADADDLAQLVTYTFGAHLPTHFVDQFKKYRSLLKSTTFPPIDLKPYQELARQTLNVLYQNFLNTLSAPASAFSLPGRLNSLVQRLSQRDVSLLPHLPELRQIAAELADVVPTLGEAGQTWLDAPFFNPGKEFDILFDSIDENKLFGKDVTQFLVDQTAIAFSNLKMLLEPINAVLSEASLLAPRSPAEALKNEKPAISKGLLSLEKALTLLFSQPYMIAPTHSSFIAQVPVGKIIFWDDKLIQTAFDLCRLFEEFRAKNFSTFPTAIQDSMRYVARKSLEEHVISLVARAQSFVDAPTNLSEGIAAEEILRAKINDVKEVSPKFIKLLEMMQQDAVAISFTAFRALVANNSVWLLTQVEKMLQSLAPYTIQDTTYTWWEGRSGAAQTAFSVRDAQDLKTYLDLQRQQLQRIAQEYAKPLVDFLTSSVMTDETSADMALINKWRRIVDQFEAYSKKQPGNTINALEDFIQSKFNTVDLKTIFQQIQPSEIVQTSGDFFVEATRQLKLGLLARAETLKRQQGIQHYKQLMSFFNEFLRNRFPFVSPNASPANGEAAPEVIREFFRLYDQFGGSPREILDQIYQLGPETNQAALFLTMMADVKSFLQNYLNGQGDNDLPTFDFVIDFRANRDREVGGDLIVDWTIKPDEDTVINKNDKAHNGRWIYGSPLEVSFRWPEGDNIPANPATDRRQPLLSVEGRTATFKYSGNWALLWMLRQQAAMKGEYAPLRDPNPYMLKFHIPTGPSDKAIVYNVITLFAPPPNPKAPGKILRVPDFPVMAPDLPDSVEKYKSLPVLTQGQVKAAELSLKTHDEQEAAEEGALEEKKDEGKKETAAS